MELSKTQENYIKCIYQLTLTEDRASNSMMVQYLGHQASTVSEQIQNLDQMGLVDLIAYKGVKLKAKGKELALQLLRQHRVWETFLVQKLAFDWDEVHDLAEELEHIQSKELINRLHQFLGRPSHDPHGDPIPDEHLNLPQSNHMLDLTQVPVGKSVKLVGIKEENEDLKAVLKSKSLQIGAELKVAKRWSFDGSVQVDFKGEAQLLSNKLSKQLIVNEIK